MFKCSECGTEYNIAPKYCDCGNDIFINTEDDFIPQEIDDIVEEIDENISKNHKGRRNIRKKTHSSLGTVILGICVILSLLVLFVIGNPKKDLTEIEIEKETPQQIEIPSIDSYWDNTSVKTAKVEEPAMQKQDNILDKIVSQMITPQPKTEIRTDATVTKTPSPAIKNLIKNTVPVKTNNTKYPLKTNTVKKQTVAKTASKPSTTQTGMTFEDLTNKIRNQYSSQNSSLVQSQQKQITQQQSQAIKSNAPIPQSTQKSTAITQTLPAQNQNTKITSMSQIKTQVQTTPVQTAQKKSQVQLKQELASYKSGLRNTIGRKIDFTRVIGDGECVLSFKINSNGRLTSKAFTKQSSNITLNDAAFNALNTTTSYNPPPDAYKGETLRLTIKFYNGNFEISLN